MSDLTIHLEYFAVLREQRGQGTETVQSQASSAAELYEHLRARHGLTLDASRVKVAVNGEFRDWDTSLKDGDTVVFIPPVAGG